MANLYAVILVIHLICAVALIILVLVQPSEAGGFMGTGSMSNLMAPRRTADVMTRMTTIMAGFFFATSLFLAISANHHQASRSILDVDAGTPPAKQGATAPVTAPTTGTDGLQQDKAPLRTGNDAMDKKPAEKKASGHDADQGASDDEGSGNAKTKNKKSDDKTGAPKAPETE